MTGADHASKDPLWLQDMVTQFAITLGLDDAKRKVPIWTLYWIPTLTSYS